MGTDEFKLNLQDLARHFFPNSRITVFHSADEMQI